MIKAVIFDCFGVLYVDAHASLAEQYPHAAQKLNELRRQSDYGLFGRQEYIQAMSSTTGLKPQEVEERIQHEHTLNRPLIDFIQNELNSQYKIGLLSNIGRGWMQDFFNEHSLHALFNAAVLSGEEGVVKPDLKIYQIMADKIGFSTSECIMIDDIPANCDGAKQAGMEAIHYKSLEDTKRQLKHLLALQ